MSVPSLAEQPINACAELSWNGLQVCNEICPLPPDRIAYPSVPEHCIIFHVANADTLERRLDRGQWQRSPSYPGGLTFVPAHQAPEWLWDAEVELLEIYFPPSLLENVAIASFDTVPQNIELLDRFAIQDSFLEHLALAFKTELQHGNPFNRLYLESLQNVLAVHLLRHHCTVEIGDASVPDGLPKSQLRQIIDYIQNNLGQEMGLAELAKVVHMSPHHFGKRFKQSMGMPPHRYLLQCRIEQAKELLANPQLSLTEISQQLGFCDQSHFTNVFRKYTTLTPRQYRNHRG